MAKSCRGGGGSEGPNFSGQPSAAMLAMLAMLAGLLASFLLCLPANLNILYDRILITAEF